MMDEDAELAELDSRMREAGMTPITELLKSDPLGNFAAHNGVRSIVDFEEWLNKRHRCFLKMRVEYELGIKPKDDLYEWVFAHSAAFGEMAANLRQALGKPV